MTDVIQLDIGGAVAHLILNRPEARNSLRLADMSALSGRLAEARTRKVRCIVLRGAGGAFCAGRDLKETDPERDDTLALMRSVINPLIQAIYEVDVPTIAAVEGPALGLGLGLALACDVVLVSETARLGSPFRNIGAVLDSGAHFFLRERIGAARTLELVLTGQLLDGRQAADLGLANRVCAPDELHASAEALAQDLASGPTAAFAASKMLLRKSAELSGVLESEACQQERILAGPDGREGIHAFQERRKPAFVGA